MLPILCLRQRSGVVEVHRNIKLTHNRGILGIYCAETALLFIGATIIGYIASGNADINLLFPHPFWIPVVLLSVQYGSSGGVMASVVAVVLFIALGLPAQDPHDDYYDYLIVLWKQPALWVLSAIVLGEIRTRHISERNFLFEQMQMFQEQRAAINEYCAVLENNLASLEHELATSRSRSLEPVLEQLTTMAGINWETLDEKLPVVMERLFGDINFSLYEKTLWGTRLVMSYVARMDGAASQTAQVSLSPLLCDMIARPSLTDFVLQRDELESYDDAGQFAVLLRDPGDDHVFAILKIDDLASDAVTHGTSQLLRMIGIELGHALARDVEDRTSAIAVRSSIVQPLHMRGQHGPVLASQARKQSGMQALKRTAAWK